MQVEIYIAEKGLFCEPKDAYEYWEKKEWLTAKHVEVKTLENAIDVFNGMVVNRAAKKIARAKGITKLPKKIKERNIKSIRKALVSGNKCYDSLVKLESFSLPKKETPVSHKTDCHMPYDEQLKDKRWEAFRRFVFAVKGKKCELCGSQSIIQVHHPKYIYGRMAWEYTCNDVMVVCKKCHEKIHKINSK